MECHFAPPHLNAQRAGALAALGKIYFEEGRLETADAHVPEYLRLSQAERELMERRKQEPQEEASCKSCLLYTSMVAVDDLYRPYRPKRRTRATIAKEKGLEPLANILLLQMTKRLPEEEAAAYISEEKDVYKRQFYVHIHMFHPPKKFLQSFEPTFF